MRTLCNATVIAALALAGCAAHAPVKPFSAPPLSAGQLGLKIQFESSPLGATVLRDGLVLGRTPFAHAEPVSAHGKEGQTLLACTSTEPVTFQWESGASVTVTNLCSQYPTVTAVRPIDAPGLEKDLRVEARVHADRAVAAKRYTPLRNGYVPTKGPGRGVVSGYELVRTLQGGYGVSPNMFPTDSPGHPLPLNNPQRE